MAVGNPLQNLYNNLISSGKFTPQELGDYETFRQTTQQPGAAKYLYGEMAKRGFTNEYDVGTPEQFEYLSGQYSQMGVPKPDLTPNSVNTANQQVSQNPPVGGDNNNPISGVINSGQKEMPKVSQPNVDNLLKNYQAAKSQYEKEPIKAAGTLPEAKVTALASPKYWAELSKNLPQNWAKEIPEKTQKFLMFLQNQSKADIESGAILQSPEISAVAPADYKKSVEQQNAELQKEQQAKSQYFNNATMQNLSGAAEYQNRPQALQVTPNMVSGVPILRTIDEGKPSPQAQQEAQFSATQDKLDQLGNYITLLNNTKDLNPQQQQDLEQSKEAYNGLLTTYDQQAKELSVKAKEYPYYIPRNDVNLLSKETGVPNAVYATLNNSLIGKTVLTAFGQNPDLRNYDPGATTKMAEQVGGLMIDAPVFSGLGKAAEGLTNVGIRALSKLPLSEEFVSSLDDITTAAKGYMADGKISAQQAYAKAFEQLPDAAKKVKSAFTVAQASEQGLNLGAYNAANDLLTQVENQKNATPGTTVNMGGKTYHIAESDGDKVELVGDDGKPLTLTPDEFKQKAQLSFGETGKSALTGLIGGASLPVVSELSNALMEGAGLSAAAPKSFASLLGQSYSFAAAQSLVDKGKLPTYNEVLQSLYFLGGMKAGTKIPELANIHNFDRYFNAEANQNYDKNQAVEKAMSVAKGLGSGEVQKSIETANLNQQARQKAEDQANKITDLFKNTDDGNVISVIAPDGNQYYVKNSAKIEDGKLVSTQQIPEVEGEKPFSPTVGVVGSDGKPNVFPLKDLQVSDVETPEQAQGALSNYLYDQLKTPTVPQSNIETPPEPAAQPVQEQTQEQPAQPEQPQKSWDERFAENPQQAYQDLVAEHGKKRADEMVQVTNEAILKKVTALRKQYKSEPSIDKKIEIQNQIDDLNKNYIYIKNETGTKNPETAVTSGEDKSAEPGSNVQPVVGETNTNQPKLEENATTQGNVQTDNRQEYPNADQGIRENGQNRNEQPNEPSTGPETSGSNIPEGSQEIQKSVGGTGEAKSTKPPAKTDNSQARKDIAKASVLDVTDPRDLALQYFIKGGTINDEALTSLYGNKGRSAKENAAKIKEEKKARSSYYRKNGATVDQIAHALWEDNADKSAYTTQDYKNAIEDVINSHTSRREMASELLDSHTQNEEKGANFGYTNEQIAEMQRIQDEEKAKEKALMDEEFNARMSDFEKTGQILTPEQENELFSHERTKKEIQPTGEPTGKEVQPDETRSTPTPETPKGEQISPVSETSTPEEIKQEEAKVETRPTEAQKEAENYRKGHIKVRGMDVSIENPKGSQRSGTDEDGNKWSQTMNNTYGYIRGTQGKDGDHVDVFLSDTPDKGKMYVVDQMGKDGKFDEHKVMIGFDSEEAAKKAYLSNYQDGWKGLGNITEVSIEDFKKWLGTNGQRKIKPFADYKTNEPKPEKPKFAGEMLQEKSDEGIKMSKTPTFYSPTEKALTQIKQDKGTPEQFKAMLLKNGAKQAELDWMGFDDAFKDKKSITKQDVQDWIDQNKVEVEEIQKGEGQTTTDDAINIAIESVNDNMGLSLDKSNVINVVNRPDSYSVKFDQQVTDIEGDNIFTVPKETVESNTKYSDYQLPGGSDYHELLLTMSDKNPIYDRMKSYTIYDSEGNIAGTRQKEEDAIKRANELNGRYELKDYGNKTIPKGNFISSHFEEPNILAHVRFNTRTDADGNKVLFLEELQSDWAQKGRKEGFKGDEKPVLDNGVYKIQKKDGTFIKNTSFENKEDAQKYINENRYGISSVPDMPFKQTDQWVKLALRRMIQYAAENGYDKIAWTTGEQQAARYDLSKQVDAIHYVKEKDGKYSFNAEKDGNEYVMVKNNVPESELESIVGKEVAQKMINNEGETKRGKDVIKGAKTLRGENLKVGGIGMNTFYDNIVPKIADKLGKPFGTKVETSDIKGVGEVNTLPISDAMREAALSEGQPLFNKRFESVDKPTRPKSVSELYSDEYQAKEKKWKDAIDEQVKTLNEETGANAKVVSSVGMLPAEVRKEVKSQNAEGNVRGIFNPRTGEIYLVRQNITSSDEVPQIILHEAVGHKGLRLVFGDEYNKILDNVSKNIPEADRQQIEKTYSYTDKNGNEVKPDSRTIADEYLARMAEQNERPTFVQKAIAQVRDMVRKVFGLDYSDNDLKYLFELSRKALKQQNELPSEGDVKLSITGEKGEQKSEPLPENPDIRFNLVDLFKNHPEKLESVLNPEDRKFYSDLSNELDKEAENKGVEVTPVKSAQDLPEDLKKSKETVVPDEKTGKTYVNMGKIKTPDDFRKAVESGKFVGGANQVNEARAERFGQEQKSLEKKGINPLDLLEFSRQELKDGADPYEPLQKIKDGKGINEDEVGIVNAHLINLEKETNRVEDVYNENPTPANKEIFKQTKAAELKYRDESAVARQFSSNVLKAWNAGEFVDYGTLSGLRRANIKISGHEFTPKEEEEAKKLSNNIKEETGQTDYWKNKAIEFMQKYQEEVEKNGFPDKKSYSEWAHKAADKVRKARIARPGMFMAATPASVVWDGAVNTVALALDGSASLVDAINKGVDFLKNSNWYKDLSAPDKNMAENQFRNYHYGLFRNKVSLDDLRAEFGDKKGNKFTPAEALRIWNYGKENYIEHGITEWGDLIHGISSDVGLNPEQVISAIATPKGMREITDEIYKHMRQVRDLNTHAKNWVLYKDKNPVLKYAQTVPRIMFSLKVLWHGGVGMITHAGKMLFDPLDWDLYFKNFKNQYRLMASKKYYNRTMAALEADPNYLPWLRAGLAVDPHRIYNDYQLFGEAFKKMTGLGERGFDILKLYRFDLANRFYSHLSNSEKADPESLKEIAKFVNHATGTVKNWKGEEWYNVAFFAPRLEAARWHSMFIDPAKAIGIFTKIAAGKEVKPSDRAFAKLVARQAGTMLATYVGALAANQALLKHYGSDYRVNITDPTQSDFLKFKIGGQTVALDGGMVNLLGFVGTLTALTLEKPKMKGGNLTSQRQNILDELSKYVSYKISPFVSEAWNQMGRQTFSGNYLPDYKGPVKPGKKQYKTWFDYLISQESPVLNIPVSEALKDIHETMTNRGMSKANASTILHGALFGVLSGGTGVRITTGRKPETPAEQEMYHQYQYKYPDYQKQEEEANLADQFAKDHNKQTLWQAVKDHKINPKDLRSVIELSRYSKLVRQTMRLNPDGAFAVYQKGSPQEKEEFRKPLIRKLKRAKEGATDEVKSHLDKMINQIK